MSEEARFEQLCDEAHQKLTQLLTCGNERVELAAAKELINLLEKNMPDTDKDINLEVTIKVL